MRLILSIWMIVGALAFAEGQVPIALGFDQQQILVTGLSVKNHTLTTISEKEWMEILPVFTQNAWSKKVNQPIAGTWLVVGDDIVFKPHFPFSAGEMYHAVFDSRLFYEHVPGAHAFANEKIELTFTLQQQEFSVTSIDAVYPASDVVPENLLRMYVHFSAPMMPGEAYDHIRLLHADGSTVMKPFLVVDQELWDVERKRFTLLFDPGRIKRTLKSNLDLGTPLKEGERYLLVIDSTWRDVNGNYLQRGLIKEFTVATAQRTKLATQHASILSPKTNTREDVVMSFNRPVDRLLVTKFVSVNSSTGSVQGVGRMVDDFTWRFTPGQEWKSGMYEIAISPWVEDVCGNNFNNVFDLDLKKEKRVSSDEVIKISFVVNGMDQ